MSVTINGTNGLTFNDNTTQATSPFAGGLGFRNRIINGDMRIDQRNNGASVTPASSNFVTDRWKFVLTQASKLTAQRSTVATAGFANSLLVTSSSAYSVLAGDTFNVLQPIEGFNTADLGWGTANAQPITLSFLARSSLTGTFGGCIFNSAGNRSYPFTYTVNVANTFEYKTITIPGDTTGTWLTDSGIGIVVSFGLGSGATFSGTAGSWSSGNFYTATGATSVVGTNGATFYITGVQLEKGSTATSFDYRPYGTELALCLRYYWRLNSSGSNSPFASGNAESTTRGFVNLTLPQPMRTQPSVGFSNIAHFALRGAGTDVVCTSGAFNPSTSSAMATIIGGEFNTGSATGASTGGCVKMLWNNASAWIDASAEL